MEVMVNYNLILAENQRLETERLVLRPVTLADASDMFEYASDEETVVYVFPLHQRLEDTEAAIADYFMSNPLGKYGIELKENKKLIGAIDLRVEPANKIAEIGYSLSRKYWGYGLVPEACEALLELGFEKLQLIRIFAKHDEENPNSGRVMDKIGMKEEGRIPNARLAKGKAVTDVIKGLTIEDWKKNRQ
ncbi:GNAT family N-acetyltransferase [Enterococcus sp. LJL128]